MRLTRIFLPGPLRVGAEFALPTDSAHHVARVLRLNAGASLIVFDGESGEYRATISRIAAGAVSVQTNDLIRSISVPPLRITLVQGISRGERMDWALQKATELGVHRLAPVLTARSVVRLDDRQGEKKLEHWRNVVRSACEQCGRNDLPELLAPVALREHLALSKSPGRRVVLDPDATVPLAESVAGDAPSEIELLIGPEGGLDVDELQAAQHAGFAPVRLGPRILRTETAAVAALAVLQALWGDLR